MSVSREPSVLALYLLAATIATAAAFSWAYHPVANPLSRQSKSGEVTKIDIESFEEARRNFVYVSGRDETLGELTGRLGIYERDKLCRDLAWQDDRARCKSGWESVRIKKGQALEINVDMLHAK